MFYYSLRIKLRREKNPFIILNNIEESGFNKTKISDIFSRKKQAVEP